MLLWAPVGVVRSRGMDVQTLILLSYLYASALTLETAFPDIGATFLSSLVAPPLEKALSVMQAYQAALPFDATTHILLSFPQKAFDSQRGASRNSWSRPSISVSSSEGGPFELSPLSIDLANQTLPDHYAYTPGLSPSFSPTTLSLMPPSIVSPSQRSPFLEVPSTSVDSFSYGAFSSSPSSYHATPASTYVTSPLTSPGVRSPSDTSDYQLSSFQHSRQSSMAEQAGFGSYDSYGLSTQSSTGGYSNSNGDGVAGGCVLPTAIWT
jgi:hypothetical protein